MPRGRSPERFARKRQYSPPGMKRPGPPHPPRNTRPLSRSRSPRPRGRPAAPHRAGSPVRPQSGDIRRPVGGYSRGPRTEFKNSRSPAPRRHSLSPHRKMSPRKLSPHSQKPSSMGMKKRSLSPPDIRRKHSPPRGEIRPSAVRMEMPPIREASRPVSSGMPKRDYDTVKRRTSPRREEKPLHPSPGLLRERADDLGLKPTEAYRYEDVRYHSGEVFEKARPNIEQGFPPDSLRPLLDERFRGSNESHSFSTDELKKITVDIRRNIPRDGGPIVRRILHPEDVILIRRTGEGSRPIFDRDDIKQGMMERDEDFVEKRVVAIVRGRSRSRSPVDRRLPSHHSGSSQHENFKVSRDKYSYEHRGYPPKPSLSDRWQLENRDRKFGSGQSEKLLVSVQASGSSVDRGSTQYRSRDESSYSGQSRPRLTPYEDSNGSRYAVKEESHIRESHESPRRPLPANPNDLRHSLLSRSRLSDLVDARQKILERRERDREPSNQSKFEYRPSESGDGRHRVPDDRFKSTLVFWEREKTRAGSYSGGIEGGDDLPNFSSRPDRYQYKEWVDKPDMVPKGPSYYEKLGRGNTASYTLDKRGRGNFQHDTRGDRDSSFTRRPRGRGIRGFGRGGIFRGRGLFRGPLRGGVFAMSRRGKRSPNQWEHDLFEKMSPATKTEQDRRPSGRGDP